jgi:hypothetical protein
MTSPIWEINGVKTSVLYFVTLFAVSCLTAKSEVPVFGNCSGGTGSAYSIGASSSGETFGAAVGFTPDANMSLSSVTLWLNGFTGQNGQTYSAEICENVDPFSQGNQPGEVIATLNTPAANNGSTKAFKFTDASGSLTLDAGQEYWLAIFGVVPSPQAGFVSSEWVQGADPIGSAVYDGAEGYSGGMFYTSSATPAFSLNSSDPSAISIAPVPEPSSVTLMIIPALLGAGRKFYTWRKSRS